MLDEHGEHEQLVKSLNDDATRAAYKTPLDSYRPSLFPRVLGHLLIGCGTLLYGRDPSYQKFRAIEVIARVPYHSWASVLFLLLTFCYTDQARSLRLSARARFTHYAGENETMHVVVISALARAHGYRGVIRFTLIPLFASFVYFWVSYVLYLVSPRWSLEMNYLFEQHAYEQYDRFLALHGDELRQRPIESEFLAWYGRHPRSEYEFFCFVRNDELIHRNQSIREINT